MTFVRPPFAMDAVPAHADDAPEFAADTFGVLSALGLSAEEIARLDEEGIAW
jgi:hypothetical protein